MAQRFPLQPLLDLAHEHSDEAGRKLQQLKVKWQEAELKLNQLAGYREEYRQRLSQNTQHGMQMAAWREFQLFMDKLDQAITLQGEEVAKCQRHWEGGRREWLERQRQLKAYGTLLQRHTSSENMREARKEQKEQDEFSGRLSRQDEKPPGE
jgi:flagellar FliJ protein